MEETQHRDYFEAFFCRLAPRFLHDRNILTQLWEMLERHKDNDDKALLTKLIREELAEMHLLSEIERNIVALVTAGTL